MKEKYENLDQELREQNCNGKNKYNFDFIVGKNGKGQAFNPKIIKLKERGAKYEK